jgi:3-oxoadipate enol-lactonase
MLHYIEKGHGLPVVLIHGFPLDSRMWQGQIEDLAGICRVIAPDLPGFGKSGSAGNFTMASAASEVRELLEKIGALPCVLGGLSMGGYVALAFAKQFPGDLKGLMLIDTRAEADSPQGKQNRQAMIELAAQKGSAAIADQMLPKLIADQSIEPAVRAMVESCSVATIQYALAAMRDREDMTAFLPTIKVPTLVLVGAQDILTPPTLAEGMHNAIANSILAVIPGAGHLSPMERPKEVCAAIGKFVENRISEREE